MKATSYEYFLPQGFMCSECRSIDDDLHKCKAGRLDNLRLELGSMAAVYQKQREWSNAMLCIFCGAKVPDTGDSI